MAVFAPMPSASESAATAVKPGLLANILVPYRRSRRSVVILCLLASDREVAKR